MFIFVCVSLARSQLYTLQDNYSNIRLTQKKKNIIKIRKSLSPGSLMGVEDAKPSPVIIFYYFKPRRSLIRGRLDASEHVSRSLERERDPIAIFSITSLQKPTPDNERTNPSGSLSLATLFSYAKLNYLREKFVISRHQNKFCGNNNVVSLLIFYLSISVTFQPFFA